MMGCYCYPTEEKVEVQYGFHSGPLDKVVKGWNSSLPKFDEADSWASSGIPG
jgi:hypothetical protein